MFLEEIAEPQTIFENSDDYGEKLYFDYQKIRRGQAVMSHPSPIVLYLGTWRMTDRHDVKKKFLCGLNLAVLADEEELAAVQKALPDILKVNNMKSRYRIGKTLLPDIFRRAYRTYNMAKISTRPVRGRLYALKATTDDKEEAEGLAAKDYPHKDWNELDIDTKSELLDKAIQSRGSEDAKRQKAVKKAEEEPELPEPELEPQLSKPKPPKPPKPPAPPKPPKKPKAEMEPLDLGPGFDEPEPAAEPTPTKPAPAPKAPAPRPVIHPKVKKHPRTEPVQSPIQSVKSSMATPQKVKVGHSDDEKEQIRKALQSMSQSIDAIPEE